MSENWLGLHMGRIDPPKMTNNEFLFVLKKRKIDHFCAGLVLNQRSIAYWMLHDSLESLRFFDIYSFSCMFMLMCFYLLLQFVWFWFILYSGKFYSVHIYIWNKCIILCFNYAIIHENFIRHCIISWSSSA